MSPYIFTKAQQCHIVQLLMIEGLFDSQNSRWQEKNGFTKFRIGSEQVQNYLTEPPLTFLRQENMGNVIGVNVKSA